MPGGGLGAYIVCGLGSLIDGNARGNAKNVGLILQIAAKLDGVGTVQASGAVVPALERRKPQGSFSDGDSLPLATADSTDKVIADTGVFGV